jgi:hypothetical protein
MWSFAHLILAELESPTLSSLDPATDALLIPSWQRLAGTASLFAEAAGLAVVRAVQRRLPPTILAFEGLHWQFLNYAWRVGHWAADIGHRAASSLYALNGECVNRGVVNKESTRCSNSTNSSMSNSTSSGTSNNTSSGVSNSTSSNIPTSNPSALLSNSFLPLSPNNGAHFRIHIRTALRECLARTRPREFDFFDMNALDNPTGCAAVAMSQEAACSPEDLNAAKLFLQGTE